MNQLSALLESSKQVIRDCSLENGAIVAANSFMPYYPKEAKNYLYVWPRDAAFTCLAAEKLGIDNIEQPFFDWLANRAEGWDKTGLFYEKYYVNGLQALSRFQPDQNGLILFIVSRYLQTHPELKEKYQKLVEDTAFGLTKTWRNSSFSIPTNDLWEERMTYPDIEENFSYSLASCITGLRSANEAFPNKIFEETSVEMEKTLLGSAKSLGFFSRSFGKLNDERIDASLLGLIWPFQIIESSSEIARKTVDLIMERLVKNDGVYRYEHDEYDGWMLNTGHRKKGAGYWPLLNFWLSIVLSQMNRKDESMRYFQKVLADLNGKQYIPEQIFDNNIQVSVLPLCWSHSMFVMAAEELEVI
ncbi:TPA: hypothetical protein DDW69_00490 [candidate division CPR2 bacterium]|uniref:Glucoamylase and related glycosyl hydrolase n=1 Tax=candidate division CPR2 bacterium GW2011_GWC1_41_48 TaxID=1618344 RepID=A0A0G0W9T4_UNCC2|nr:MAG: Glucoamylase and related glycosyl hydrolase [candidate division CPR2 bacterium GW2011_GWC2_39_35]KKR28650.1 MAG: Glucoamylase and related glycosyl hydrolase [candidate division CPR2 bacterium GW2011_GWD2_39_7]KKR28788.1 MAG: Glucoamylase and related glycosyl hydrolase [candidate division CPR2 bacterium GW2011_GWD1_39_7]KKS08817.1 MAG: Glucoamylase and related glycosyl hydrolase [candidate division CPR2 bacterium GW2011_GWC1_41_48]OGB72955.1 MAG: hypothetical protein A2Y26_02475 [candida